MVYLLTPIRHQYLLRCSGHSGFTGVLKEIYFIRERNPICTTLLLKFFCMIMQYLLASAYSVKSDALYQNTLAFRSVSTLSASSIRKFVSSARHAMCEADQALITAS